MRIEVVTIGGEILSGRIRDENFVFLARALASRGLAPFRHSTVSDDRADLDPVLRRAWSEAEGVVLTGGLGATSDDRTRPAIAAMLGVDTVLLPEVWAELQRWFIAKGRTAPPVARVMAELPRGAEPIPNPLGLAPGVWIDRDGRWLCALPGVPHEMRAMVERSLLPKIDEKAGNRRSLEHVFRTAGLSETVLAEWLGAPPSDAMEIGFLPHAGGVDLRLQGRTGGDAGRFSDWVCSTRERLGDTVFSETGSADGETSLEAEVGRLLVERGAHVAVAESLSGGALTARLVSVPGASRYVDGSVVAYANRVKESFLGVSPELLVRHGAVSAETAEAMAEGARARFGAEFGLSTTGIAGPTGGSDEKPVGLVYTGISWEGGAAHLRRIYPGGRAEIIERSVQTGLLMLYRRLRGLPLEPALVEIPS